MTAVVESPVLVGTQAPQYSAVALGDAELLPSAQEQIATAFRRLEQIAVIEEFLRAHAEFLKASERLRLTDTGGWGDDEAERLHGVAEDAWGLVTDTWFVMDTSWAARLLVVDEALNAGAEYVGRRRRVTGHAVVQSGPVDWSRGR